MSAPTGQPGPSIKRPVSRPKRPLPPGAWDCHAHVFGPFARFPVLLDRRYEPPHAPAEDYLEMLDRAGFAKGVLVHASANGFDNSTTADALAREPGRVVGVGVVARDVPDTELERMHAAGFRALRFTVTDARAARSPGTLGFDDLEHLAPRLKALGWHAQIWARCDAIVAARAALAGYGIPMTFDHMGYFDPALGLDGADFRSFVDLVAANDFAIKLSVVRVSKEAPAFANVRRFHEHFLARLPDQLLFGADWPFIALDDDPPDVGRLVDLFDDWTPDDALRRKILVDNPERFFRRR